MTSDYDLCIIGGGINGAGIAREAATRGLRVFLAEEGDLAGATSSASTKLIHGGLRYLEYGELKLVHEALAERKTMLKIAPHLVRPLTFVLPHDRGLRPVWMIRAGLFLYDHLADHGGLSGSRAIDLNENSPYAAPLNGTYKRGFTYSDCRVDDARLVILNAIDAKERGAVIRTRTRCTGIKAQTGRWDVALNDGTETIHAAMLVNAAGPWVRHILDDNRLVTAHTPSVRLVKGGHIVTRKLFEGGHAYILQQPDKRIVFAIPYENDFTLIGTTDEDFSGDPRHVAISTEETVYLCEAVNRSFRKRIGPSDIVWSYAGVRPLFDDGRNNASSVTRDYHLTLDDIDGMPLLSVFGGKITTYRRLAEDALIKLSRFMHLPDQDSITDTIPLPGGDISHGGFSAFLDGQIKKYPWLPRPFLERIAHAYGTRMDTLIGNATDLAGLGQHFGDHVYEAEIRYLTQHEWARTVDDIFWRRSKLGLTCTPETMTAVEQALLAGTVRS